MMRYTKGTCAPGRLVRHRGMRVPLALVFIFFLLVSLLPAAAQEKSEAETVRSLELKWTESYKQREVGILSTLLADDFVITLEDGSTYSKTGYISHSAESFVHVNIAQMADMKVRMHGNTAIVTGSYHEQGESKGKPYNYHDRFTDVWMKSAGKWQVVASHYSVAVR